MEEYEARKRELTNEIVKILSEVENIKIIEYFYQFIKTAVTKWK